MTILSYAVLNANPVFGYKVAYFREQLQYLYI